MRKKYIKTVAAGFGMTLALMAPKAEALTFELYKEYSGATAPEGTQPPPWLTATFTQLETNKVSLTMTATNLTGTEFIDDWFFNTVRNAQDLVLTPDLPNSDITASVVTEQTKADGGGYFDFVFDFPSSNSGDRFGAGMTSSYLITAAGLLESDFNVLSSVSGANGTYYSAAHIQSIDGEDSGYIGDDTPDTTPVPEPSTFLLLGAGLFAVAVAKKRKASAS